jgi:hypothetical protein
MGCLWRSFSASIPSKNSISPHRQDFRALEIELEPHFLQAGRAHGLAQSGAVRRVEHQKAPAAGTDEFAAEGAILHREAIPFIDPVVAHARRAGALAEPMLVHEGRKPRRVAALQAIQAAVAQLFRAVQVLDHRRIRLLAPRFLVLQNLRGRARVAGEKQQQVVLEVMNRILAECRLAGFHAAVLVESERRDPAIRGDELVLLADRLAQPPDFNLASLLRQLVRMHEIPVPSVQRLQQRRGETPRGPQPRPRRDALRRCPPCFHCRPAGGNPAGKRQSHLAPGAGSKAEPAWPPRRLRA